ncbi:ABC transporter permease, partial [bacterium]|nr:ABC transporter permease [bacterium]
WSAKLDTRQPQSRTTTWSLGIKNINRRLKSSLGIIAMLAIGIFMIISVSANRQNEYVDAAKRSSGTGGFSLFCKTTHPINKDLNTEPGQKAYGLKTALLQDTQFLPLRLKAGNDASCLNINRTFVPHILGVNASTLAKRGSFTFAATLKDLPQDGINPWKLLNTPLANGKIPAIADQTAIQWGLGKKIGDSISLSDDQGKQVELQLVAALANSIFQGYVLISEQHFLRHFSSVGGFQVILVDSSKTPQSSIQQELERAFLPMGIEISDTADRLAEFNTVQNTYLSIFLLLGGLGLMLSTLGLGIVLARNIIERRGELALLSAVGYTRKQIRALILSEYSGLLLAGIIIGTVSGLIAVLPVITVPGTSIPYTLLISVVIGITLTGLGSLYLGSHFALPNNLVKGLREE